MSEETEVRNIEWFKGRLWGRKFFHPKNDKEIGYNKAIDEFSEYVDQLEMETVEITEGHVMSESEWAEDIARYKMHLEQEGYIVIEKPTIPRFVAEYLDERKETPIYRLVDSNFIYDIDDDLARWLYNNDNRTNNERELILVLAHKYGYEAEEDPKYIIDTDDIEISDGNHYLINLTLTKNSVELPIVGDKSDAVQFDDINQAQAIASYVGGRVEVLEE